jgi:cytochrome c551/c552
MSAGTKGEAIFKSKGCFGCHSGYSSLADQIKGRTLTEIGASMWNHGSSMPAAPAPFAAGEMRELLSYLWARQFFVDAGDARRGKRVFVAKRCGTCHDDASSGAPKLAGGQLSFTGVTFTGATMVSALWHHGPRMLEQMNDRRIQWPRFDGREMSNLIAYLNAGDRAK